MNMMNILIAFLFCAFLYVVAKCTRSYIRSKNPKRINLLTNIHQKIFMTAWLGFFFAGFFLILCILAGYVFEKKFFLSFFYYGKEHPETFFYLGGVLFISMTLLVYLVRIAGKRVYSRMQKSRKKY